MDFASRAYDEHRQNVPIPLAFAPYVIGGVAAMLPVLRPRGVENKNASVMSGGVLTFQRAEDCDATTRSRCGGGTARWPAIPKRAGRRCRVRALCRCC